MNLIEIFFTPISTARVLEKKLSVDKIMIDIILLKPFNGERIKCSTLNSRIFSNIISNFNAKNSGEILQALMHSKKKFCRTEWYVPGPLSS